ncbi:MAG: hypothetical protein RIR11_2681, partial [Bacteroidota bacterium]
MLICLSTNELQLLKPRKQLRKLVLFDPRNRNIDFIWHHYIAAIATDIT